MEQMSLHILSEIQEKVPIVWLKEKKKKKEIKENLSYCNFTEQIDIAA